jgi:uncharacterized protein (TIGR03084 family)
MMVELAQVLADLRDESADLDDRVAGLSTMDWALPTPAAGWTIGHQIAHLAWTDHVSVLAVLDPDAFTASLSRAAESPESYVDEGASEFLTEPPALLARWRAGREALASALAELPAGTKVPWYGVSMSATSMATARIMETWAHGLDVADALGVVRQPTARLRHIAHLGHRTLQFGFMTHDRPVPDEPVRLELSGPDGALWTYGPEEAANRVTGPALDFCQLVTQRRNRADLSLVPVGPVADEWLDVAQCFAGPTGPGRPPAEAAA